MTKLILGAFLATSFLFYGYSTHKCDSNVQLVANLANYFKVAQFCDHKYNLVVSVDSTYNRWDLRYTTTVEESENIDELCKCMRLYLNQGNWLDDTTHLCVKNCDLFTFILLGPTNPDENQVVTPFAEPIAALCSVMKRFPNAELGDYTCASECYKNGEVSSLQLKCKLTCELPSPKAARENIVQYLSQSSLLTNATVTAKGDGQWLDVTIVGK